MKKIFLGLMKFVITIWDYTIRALLNYLFNKKWDKKIDKDFELKTQVINHYNEIYNTKVYSENEIQSIYENIYTEYKHDPFKGLIDWSPSLSTVLAREVGDCDDMGLLWKHLGKKYCETMGYEVMDINTYAFTYLNPKAWHRSHVMCLSKIKDDGEEYYLLFDYSQKIKTKDLFGIREYYLVYLKGDYTKIPDNRLDASKVCLTKLREPKTHLF